jgi:hypothetical protein
LKAQIKLEFKKLKNDLTFFSYIIIL